MREHCRRGPAYIVLVCLSVAANAAPVTLDTALPVGKGQYITRVQFMDLRLTDPESGARMDRRGGSVALAYGICADLAAFVAVPYERLRVDADSVRRSTSGLGDTRTWLRWTIVQRDAPGSTFRVAPFLGLAWPTGDDAARDDDGLLPPSLQPGGGGVGAFGGLILTWQRLAWQIDLQAAHLRNREGDHFRRGNMTRFDASVQRRLWPVRLEAGVPGFLLGGLELNYIREGRTRIDGVALAGSGADRLWLSPTLQWVSRRWAVEAAYTVPVSESPNPGVPELDRGWVFGARFTF